jgi:phage shock protein PspC (stress-responsive transcriptional regulator)/predicted membrane protein
MSDDPHTPQPDPTGPTEPMTSGDPLAGPPPAGDAPKGDAPPPGGAGPSVRRFTRSSSDKLIGGVAGGLGRYFGVDPILFRIAFVVLTFAGGVGVLAYIGLLAFVPADDDSRVFGSGRGANLAGAVVLGILVLVLLGPPAFFLGPVLLPIALLVGVGVLLWRAAGGSLPSGGDPARLVARGALALLIGIAAVGAFLGVFALAALGGGTVLAVLAVVAGLGLVVAAFAGGARWLIVPALVLVLPLAIVAAADIDVDGGVGERSYRPASTQDLRPEYRLGMGELVVDLHDVELPAGRTDMHVQVGVGHTIVRVPEDACVSSDVQIGVGHADVLDRSSDGVDVAFAQTAAAAAGAKQLHLDADIGIGALEVRRGDEPLFDRGWRGDAAAEEPVACP